MSVLTPDNPISSIRSWSWYIGGVGQLAGTVYARTGFGFASKLLEGWQGAVLAKIAILVFIVIFIQKRPQGLFALKGRSVET
jgi:urea transport system permease protein